MAWILWFLRQWQLGKVCFGFSRIQLEGDSQQVISLIQKNEEVNSGVGVIISNIGKCRQSFEAMKVSFVRRSENCVAKNAVRVSGVRTWKFCPPSWWLSLLGSGGAVVHSPHYTCSPAN